MWAALCPNMNNGKVEIYLFFLIEFNREYIQFHKMLINL